MKLFLLLCRRAFALTAYRAPTPRQEAGIEAQSPAIPWILHAR